MILKYTGPGGKTRVSFPKFGTFEFSPEGEVPDEFTEAINHLKADGYIEVKGNVQVKKEVPGKVITPKVEEKPADSTLKCGDCGKPCASEFGLMAHKRHCKRK